MFAAHLSPPGHDELVEVGLATGGVGGVVCHVAISDVGAVHRVLQVGHRCRGCHLSDKNGTKRPGTSCLEKLLKARFTDGVFFESAVFSLVDSKATAWGHLAYMQ